MNLRVDRPLYRALEAVAHLERRSVPQAARQLIEEGLHHRTAGRRLIDDTSTEDIALLAAAGGAFGWLGEEPDLYDDTLGEPV